MSSLTVAASRRVGYNIVAMAISDELKQTAGKALGRIPSGVYILTAAHQGEATAMMASWVQQAGFDPPAVSIAMAKGRPIMELITASKMLALSIIPEGDSSLMKRYARGVKPGEDPFAGVETFRTPSGIPAMKSALAWLECRVIHTCDFGGDHDLIVAEVVAGNILHPGGVAFMHQRGSGFHY
jgi:3-hydroxy-9,10-secoandrosta-1,3,5(10)-triene-9,17-dione monooxygenase reductase component